MNRGKKNFTTWQANWVQRYESAWGVLEKFKFANVLNGNELISVTGNHKVQQGKSISNGLRELISMSALCEVKTAKYVGFDLHEYNKKSIKEALHVFPNKEHVGSVLYPVLSFCEVCMKDGYHSIFHQIKLYDRCAFHPEEKLNVNCPCCRKIFRDYNIGKSEEAFCCQHCKNCIIGNSTLQKMKIKWKKCKVIKNKVIEKWLKIQVEEVNKNQYYYPAVILNDYQLSNGAPNIYSKFPDLFNRLFTDQGSSKKEHFVKMKVYCNRNGLRYLEPDNSFRWNDSFKKIYYQFTNEPAQKRPSYREINLSLLYEYFLQTKAIFKSAERYILNKRIFQHKKCIKKDLANHNTSANCIYSKAFIEWKSECYGFGLETWRINRPLGWRVNEFHYHEWVNDFQFYPRYKCLEHLESILWQLSKNKQDYPFGIISNISNNILYNILIERFDHYLALCKDPSFANQYWIHDDNISLFILVIPNNNKEGPVILY
ncbi:hypothetical protein [Sporosarcina koreensis]|uniref:TniQ protein n=1 Tax=Sporosarcina koreensis TaxID=334735 RepID=A0ABW0TX90_9BACL